MCICALVKTVKVQRSEAEFFSQAGKFDSMFRAFLGGKNILRTEYRNPT